MKKIVGRLAIIIGAGLISTLTYIINNNAAPECDTIYHEETVEGGYIDASNWIDPMVATYFRELSSSKGAKIIVVFHHTVTSDGSTAREICNITHDRFGMGCSYAATIHPNGKVIQANKFEEYTPSVGGMNTKVISFAFVGNYEENPLPDIMLKRACQIKAAFEKYSEENPDFKVEYYSLHKDHKATACPGKYAAEALIEWGIVDNPNSKYY